MRQTIRAAGWGALGLLLAACLPSQPAPEPEPADSPAPRPVQARRSSGSGTVIDFTHLGRAGGDLLASLQGRVPNLRVERIPGRRCPLVVMRGERTLNGSADPVVYVDGTAMTDTCILSQLRVSEVATVELYPGGISPGAGYAVSPNGVILVFLRDGGTGS